MNHQHEYVIHHHSFIGSRVSQHPLTTEFRTGKGRVEKLVKGFCGTVWSQGLKIEEAAVTQIAG
jgi:hypothetical protein